MCLLECLERCKCDSEVVSAGNAEVVAVLKTLTGRKNRKFRSEAVAWVLLECILAERTQEILGSIRESP